MHFRLSRRTKTLHHFDIAFLILLPLFAASVSLATQANYLVSILLFFGLPAMWLALRDPHMIRKAAVFALGFGIPLVLLVDYLGELNQAWVVPETAFPFQILGVVSIEDLMLAFIYIFFIVMFYEFFLEKRAERKMAEGRFVHLVVVFAALLLIFVPLALTRSNFFEFSFFYAWLLLLLIATPVVAILVRFPALIRKFAIAGAYFALLLFLYEFIGLELGLWVFPSEDVIGWVEIGKFRFPFEELIGWVSLTGVTVLAFYEFFDDDRR